MASTFALLLTTLTLLRYPPLTAANLHTTTSLLRSHPISDPTTSLSAANTPPTTFFEVTKPISLPKTIPCSYLILNHDFAYTYGKSPILADYKPPSNCTSQNFAKIVLEWTATCEGRQFDRIFGIWLGGVEILRSCTAEPRASGIIWTVKKDITRYYSLLMSNQTLAVYLGNLVDSTYTGVYHANITVHFYPAESSEFKNGQADLILPISRNLPLNDGLWFEIENSTDVKSKEFIIPRNTYRSVLEVYVSFHENDEFWFGNFPNDYISSNNLTGPPGNGPFREVVVTLDDDLVAGAVWPFTVIYTGGVNPLMWRPITGIGSFDLPSYDIEITPLLGKILDEKTHKFSFSVKNALNVWYINANLHVWLDLKSEETRAEVLEYIESPISLSLVSNFTGFDGLFVTNVSRSIVSSGWVKSSRGVVTTKSVQGFEYSNTMVLGHDGNLQILNQVINVNSSVFTKMASYPVRSSSSRRRFRIYLHSDSIDKGNGTYESVANVSLGFDEKRREVSGVGVFTSKLKNLQNADGNMVVKGNLVVSGLGSTQQEYHYTSDKSCYFRNVSSSNYTVLHDEESDICGKILELLPSFPQGTF
ncbi:peptide-n4-(n-acetyl-beta-glucosaminyl) asparagine amidase a [Phtheirospermum japonicum]|uniref:Peptide-n4-(N-acetyl-beta-glucosaminyl) asparagine amidase a n=1 Tax=Phtheirospermum japonicum TaxID=374723 RepID=A0A830B650_9LAMI|nr:peptide-n4-(n-acetyl-beta-glucosaminyl) asparagine amidase a [Phtheirospermum japonicum]